MLQNTLQQHAPLTNYLKPIQKYLDDKSVTEIAINYPKFLWTESSEGWVEHEVNELTVDYLKQLARLIATANNKKVDDLTPVLSASLPTGERCQIILPPMVRETVSITIRRPSEEDKTLEELEKWGTFSSYEGVQSGLKDFEIELLDFLKKKDMVNFFRTAVLNHQNIMIAGKTGSGKTTVTKSLALEIPQSERLITIEDTPELDLKAHRNKVHLFYSRGDEGGSNVTAKSALASCLRMKPDRILLAELRGDEAWDYIKSINTGHAGSISTMHANGAVEAFEQLTAFVKDSPAGAHLETDYVKRRIYETLDIVVFFKNYRVHEVYYEPQKKHDMLNNK